MDCFFLSEASEVNFRTILKRAQTSRCLGSRKKASINQKTHGQTSRRGQRSGVEKSKGAWRRRYAEVPLLDPGCVRERCLCCGGVAALFHVKPHARRDESFIMTIWYGLTPRWLWPPSCQFWPPVSLMEGYLRSNMITGALPCLLCFEGFMSSRVAIQGSSRRGWKLRVTLSLGWGGGGRRLKGAYCCSSRSGFDCLRFDLVWGVCVVQCYPPMISAISETLQWERHRLRVCSGLTNIFHMEGESPDIWMIKLSSKRIHQTPT